jgi:hypothetical protein
MPAPVLWGDEARVRERLRDGIAELNCVRRTYRFHYPFPPNAVVEFYRNNYGPMARAFATLDALEQEKLRNDLVYLWSIYNTALGDITNVSAEYLEVIATRA